jgi:uncharacterized membrane protein (UPF0182 family)
VAQQFTRGSRRWIVVAVAAIIAVALLLSAISGFYIDLLWFREVHFGSVFWTVYWSKVLLGTLAGLIFFSLLVANLVIARRLTPRFRPFSPEQEMMERYRAVIDPYARYIIPIFAAVISIFVGLAGSGEWQTFLLWRHAAAGAFPAALADKVFHRDPGFYIFSLPFLKYVQGWLFSSLVGITVIVAIAHYLSGGIRVQSPGEKVTPQVKAHLSVLFGLIFLVKAWGYYLGKFDLLVSPRGVVTGASYTDIHAELPALRLLVFIAIACAILFLVNIRVRGWALPIFGIGLLALTSIVAGAIVPAIVQKFRVAPQEFQKEETFISRNIAATRFAYGIDRVRLTQQSLVSDDVTSAAVDANAATVQNIRLWSPDILRQTYDSLQRIQPYYEFSDVDVDRYNIDGQRRLVMLSPREVRQSQIPGGGATWQNQHLFYTHGFAAVASPVNTVTTEGLPVFVLQNIPPSGRSGIPLSAEKGSQIYYGETSDVPYVVADSKMRELNFPDPNGSGLKTTSYAGDGGIKIGNVFRRLVFAYRYHDFNLLISGLIDGDSKILINRDIRQRIAKAAPFLLYDRDPYAAIVGGRLKYILDGYTTTASYPYSQRVDLASTTNGDLAGQINYIRNSVKAVVDAYDGTVKFYVVDPTDPMIRVWQRVFPRLFSRIPSAATPALADLRQHFRYPEDLMLVQANQFANYHVTDAQTFYGKEKFWALPGDPSEPGSASLRPYYVLLRLPGATTEQFVLFEPFTPFNRPNMVAYMVGQSDPGLYPGLQAVEFPGGENVDGPSQVFARINQDPTFSQQRTLLSTGGSTVSFGNLLIIPIGDSFLYVQPFFVISSQQNAIPELKRVIVVHGGSVAVADSLQNALAASFGQTPTTPTQPTPPTTQPTGKVAQLLAQAVQHFTAAEADLKKGDLAGYQKEINLAQQLVRQAETQANKATASPSPSPSASP